MFSKKLVVKSLVVGSAVLSSGAFAATGAAPAFISVTTLQPIADNLIATLGIVGGIAITILASVLVGKIGMGMIKNFIAKAS